MSPEVPFIKVGYVPHKAFGHFRHECTKNLLAGACECAMITSISTPRQVMW
jgi:hypothetical protein